MSPVPSGTGSRAEPELNGSGLHARSAVYDFSNTFMFSRWSIVMETGKATLMKDLRFSNDRWNQTVEFPDGLGRAGQVAVWDSTDDLAIVAGGYHWVAGMADREFDQPLYTYDPATGAWSDRGPSKVPSGAAGAWDPVDRCLIVCGGTDSASGRTGVRNETWAYHPRNDTWVRRSDMPAPRHGQCAVWDPDDDLMLVFGGTNGSDYYPDVWSYDFSIDTWANLSIVSDEIPLPRAYSSAVWNPLNKEMLVHGGLSSDVTFLSTWAFSYVRSTWIHRTSAPFARYMNAAGWDSDANSMIVFGAGEYDYTDTWTYDASSDSWGANSPLPGALRTTHAGVFDPIGGRMIVFGGRDAAGDCLNETWAYTPGELKWTYFSPGHMQPPVLDLGAGFHSIDSACWTERSPAGTDIALKVRTSDDNVSWGSWDIVKNGARPAPQGRYLQWNMTFTAAPDLLHAPELGGVLFNYTVNQRPSSAASGNATVFKRQPVALHGTGSDPDQDPLVFSWRRLTAAFGAFDDPNATDPTYTPLAAGTHDLQLVVNDSFDDSAGALVRITVVNRPPEVTAGPDRTGFKNETIALEGGATDADGDTLFLNWTQQAGPAVEIASPTSIQASFTPTRAGNYTFMLKADDGDNSSFAVMNLSVQNRGPRARLEATPVHAGIMERVNFSAAGSSDPDGGLVKYLIDFGDGTDTGWTAKPSIGYYYTAPGVYNATARVMDDDNSISDASAPVTITVENALPVVNASYSPAIGNSSTEFRFKVAPSSYDPDGTIVSYAWNFGDGMSASGSPAAHTYSRPGNYTVVLRVTDDRGGASEVRFAVIVINEAPYIISTSPGKLSEMRLGKTAQLSVNAFDPEGSPLAFNWKVDSQPAGGNASAFEFRPARKGDFRISVTVSDGDRNATFEWGVSVREKPAPEATNGSVMPVVAAAAVVALVVAVAVLALRRRPGG